ncbi:hypothetical protein DBR19_02060 [Aeromonas sp. HMWF014]|nr:hypothetical protein DBR19_02060 [Aeromonas sp. HMWF014]
MIMTLVSLTRLGLAVAAVLISGSAAASIVPIITDIRVQWISNGGYNGTVTLTATDVTDQASLSALDTATMYSPSGHRHKTAGGLQVLATIKSINLSGSRTQKIAAINNSVFGTNFPAPGTSVDVALYHVPFTPDVNDPECIGTYLWNSPSTQPSYSTVRPWPTSCVTLPPPNQSCKLSLVPANSVVDLGVVANGTVLTAIAQLRASCNVTGNITIQGGSSTSVGPGTGSLKSISVVDRGQTKSLPAALRVNAGSPLDFPLHLDFVFSGSGQSTNNVVITWFPS